MNTGNIEKLFVSANNVKDKADDLLHSIFKEFDVSDVEDITDEMSYVLCKKLIEMSEGIEGFRDYVVENDL